MNEDIKIEDNDIDECSKFAEKVVNETYNRFSKSDETRKQRIFYGKIGELVFLRYLSLHKIEVNVSEMFLVYPGKENADKFDFETKKGKTIDIKTAYENFHVRILIPFDQFDGNKAKDYYVGIKLDMNNRTAKIHGFTTKEKLLQNGKQNFGEGDAYWERLDNLVDIKELLKEM